MLSHGSRSLFLLLSLAWTPFPAGAACRCLSSFLPCNQTAASDVVFVGTVESIKPLFLSRWNLSNRSAVKSLNDAYMDARAHPSAESISHLKEVYQREFPEIAADQQDKLQDAKTAAGVASLFYNGVGGGIVTRFQVKTLFKHEEGDDDDSKKGKKDEDDKIESLDVWTPFGECGVDFQAGETYVVYANSDEESGNELTTDSCSRTRRLSEAGDDLAYLFFYKNTPDSATRVRGFATTDELYQVGFDRAHDPDSIRAPAGGVVIELQSGRLTRFAETDRNGRFVFDGVPEGDYKLSAYPAGYPMQPDLLAGPQAFHAAAKACVLQVLLLPKPRGQP